MSRTPAKRSTKETAAKRRETVVEPLMVPPSDACALLSVGLTKVYKLMGSGELPSVRLGRNRLIPMSAIRAIVERAA